MFLKQPMGAGDTRALCCPLLCNLYGVKLICRQAHHRAGRTGVLEPSGGVTGCQL